jgi:hypothetical protein
MLKFKVIINISFEKSNSISEVYFAISGFPDEQNWYVYSVGKMTNIFPTDFEYIFVNY